MIVFFSILSFHYLSESGFNCPEFMVLPLKILRRAALALYLPVSHILCQ